MVRTQGLTKELILEYIQGFRCFYSIGPTSILSATIATRMRWCPGTKCSPRRGESDDFAPGLFIR